MSTFLSAAGRALSVAATLLPALALAQGSGRTQPGYLITAAGDTLRGQLTIPQYATDNGIVFRADAQAPARRYQVSELRALGLHDGRYFVRRTLAAARNPETGAVDSATVLLQQLVAGKASLYRYEFNTARHTTLRPGNSPGERVQYFVGAGGTNLAQLRPATYQAILGAIFSDCPAAGQQVSRTSFHEYSLGNLVLRYDTLCPTPVPARDHRLARVPNPIRVLVSVQAGLQQGKLFYSQSPYLTSRNSQATILPAYGLELRVANNGPWSIITGVQYGRLRGEHTQPQPAQLGTVNAQETLQLPATAEVVSTQLPLLLRYSRGHARLQPYVAAGLMLGRYTRNSTRLSYPTLTYVGGNQTYYRNDVVTELVSDAQATHLTFGGTARLGLQMHLARHLAPLFELYYSVVKDDEYNPGLSTGTAGHAPEDLGDLHYRALGLKVGIEF